MPYWERQYNLFSKLYYFRLFDPAVYIAENEER